MAAEISRDPWATLDEILGVQPVAEVDEGIGPVAFYGRCSTEDNQDPETSHGWQMGNATKFVGPLGGQVVAEFLRHRVVAVGAVGAARRSVPVAGRVEAAGPGLEGGGCRGGDAVLVRQPVLVDRAPVRRVRG